MEDLSGPFKNMKKALFTESVDSDEEFTDILNICCWKTDFPVRKSLSCGDVRDDFYTPEVGKEMILRHETQEVQAGNILENVTSCSSWEVNSHHPTEGFARTVNRQCRELFLDYKDFTECSLLTCSTPVSDGRTFFPTTPAVSKTKDKILKTAGEFHPEFGFARRDSALFPMMIYCATAANEITAPKIVGSVKKKNTRTLQAREIIKDPSQASGSSKGNPTFKSFQVHGSDDTTLKTSVKNNFRSLNVEEDRWIVQPQALELDANGKGRLVLINKSSYRNLKFKIAFNGKLINVCPQSGNLRSNSQIGIRVNLSRGVKENANKVMEDIIFITCGNMEKRVPVKICKVQKINSIKDRSFRCF